MPRNKTPSISRDVAIGRCMNAAEKFTSTPFAACSLHTLRLDDAHRRARLKLVLTFDHNPLTGRQATRNHAAFGFRGCYFAMSEIDGSVTLDDEDVRPVAARLYGRSANRERVAITIQDHK